MIKGRQDAVFDTANHIFLSLVLFVVAYPLYWTVIASFSDPDLVNLGRVWLIPLEASADAYMHVLRAERLWLGYYNSLIYMALGTLLSLSLVLTVSYGLSRKGLVGRGVIMAMFVFTMFFSGGLVPTFLLVRALGMVDTRLALIIPSAVGVWHIIITRTFYESTIPGELYEAAKIDGASDASIFLRIVLPLSKPIIAVIALFVAVGQWNSFFPALVYLPRSRALHPLQMVLREVLLLNQSLGLDPTMLSEDEYQYLVRAQRMAETMRYALIIVASAPLLIIYPFVQKHFVKGVMIGSLKG